MDEIIPTVEDILSQTAIGWNYHEWPVEGGVITITTENLMLALNAAYDPSMSAWPTMVEIDESTAFLFTKTKQS
jgi:hypothetical protein